jgi:hypothetical protein
MTSTTGVVDPENAAILAGTELMTFATVVIAFATGCIAVISGETWGVTGGTTFEFDVATLEFGAGMFESAAGMFESAARTVGSGVGADIGATVGSGSDPDPDCSDSDVSTIFCANSSSVGPGSVVGSLVVAAWPSEFAASLDPDAPLSTGPASASVLGWVSGPAVIPVAEDVEPDPSSV